MPSRDEILQRVLAGLEPLAPEGVELDEDTDLVQTMGLDSVKVLDMLLDIEDDFDVEVPLEALVDVNTVGQLVTVVHRRIKEQ